LNKKKLQCLFLCILLTLSSLKTVYAVESVEVQGLLGKKIVLQVDGKRHILRAGKISPEGVKVISINSEGAVLEIDGIQKQVNLGSSISTTFIKRQSQKETIFVDSGGMYKTFGSINGHSVRFLIDTGASTIAMNITQAKQLGILYDKVGKPARVSTASGFVKAYSVRLKSVSVGSITETNVEALVIDGHHPGPILLGMTFLGRLNVEHGGNAMTLLQK